MEELKKDNTECVCSQTDFDIDVQKRNLPNNKRQTRDKTKHNTQVSRHVCNCSVIPPTLPPSIVTDLVSCRPFWA